MVGIYRTRITFMGICCIQLLSPELLAPREEDMAHGQLGQLERI